MYKLRESVIYRFLLKFLFCFPAIYFDITRFIRTHICFIRTRV